MKELIYEDGKSYLLSYRRTVHQFIWVEPGFYERRSTYAGKREQRTLKDGSKEDACPMIAPHDLATHIRYYACDDIGITIKNLTDDVVMFVGPKAERKKKV